MQKILYMNTRTREVFNMAVESNYSSNPFQLNNKPSDEKLAEMKKAQEEKRAEYASILDEYRNKYELAKKDCVEAQSIFLRKQQELAKHNENDKDYDALQQDFLASKKAYRKSDSEKELRLQLLQFRTDNYVSVSKLNILDLA